MALRGLKGGGYVTYKAMESMGVTDDDVAGKTKDAVDALMAGGGLESRLARWDGVVTKSDAVALWKERFPKTKIDADAFETHGIQEIGRGMERVYQDFPFLHTSLIRVRGIDNDPSVMGSYSPSLRTLNISTMFSANNGAGFAKSAAGDKFQFHPPLHPKTSPFQCTVLHELGHVIYQHAAEIPIVKDGIPGKYGAYSVQKVFKAWAEKVHSSVIKDHKKLSGYAKKNHEETFAEAFSDAYGGGVTHYGRQARKLIDHARGTYGTTPQKLAGLPSSPAHKKQLTDAVKAATKPVMAFAE